MIVVHNEGSILLINNEKEKLSNEDNVLLDRFHKGVEYSLIFSDYDLNELENEGKYITLI